MDDEPQNASERVSDAIVGFWVILVVLWFLWPVLELIWGAARIFAVLIYLAVRQAIA